MMPSSEKKTHIDEEKFDSEQKKKSHSSIKEKNVIEVKIDFSSDKNQYQVVQ